MTKGKPNPNWKKLVHEWRDSGKSASIWCQEQQIPMNTLSGWKKRLKLLEDDSDGKGFQKPFVELKNSRPLVDSGVLLEIDGVNIRLQVDFDEAVFTQCLDCLRGGRS